MKGMARRFKRMDDVPWQSEVEVLRCSHLFIFTFFTEVERTSRISRVSFFGGITVYSPTDGRKHIPLTIVAMKGSCGNYFDVHPTY